MLYVDIPSREEYSYLADIHADACISIYLETSPLRQHLEASKIQLGNFIRRRCCRLQTVAWINAVLPCWKNSFVLCWKMSHFGTCMHAAWRCLQHQTVSELTGWQMSYPID